METKNHDDFVLKTLQSPEYQHHFLVPPAGLSGGLALLWKKDLDLEVLRATTNYIDTRIIFKRNNFFFTFIYGSPQQENRAAFWEEISLLGQGRDSAWALTGDFNDILDNSEKSGGPPRAEGSFIAFRSFVYINGIWDVKHTGNQLSWRGKRHTHDIKSRLDRTLANVAWFDMFPSGSCNYLRYEGSDHRPLMTYCGTQEVKQKRPFRYDRRLNDNAEARKIIEEAWKADQQEALEVKISRCRREIIKWAREQKEINARVILHKQSELEKELTATILDIVKITALTENLMEAYKAEELFWRQRSRILWLQGGDKNSAYFHAVTKGRKAINRLSTIENAEGVPVYEEEEIGRVFAEFYKKLFTSNGNSSFHTVEETISRCITDEMNDKLCQLPDMEEVRIATFAIHSDKAPGPDGFSSSFYQAF